jgi:pyruvate formate-lyase activating enzyme-like uncharacterized protein
MISSKDILTILVARLRKELKDIPIECRDVKEGYRRGSIHIYFENLKASDYMKKFRETTLNVRIIYHPKNDDDIGERLDMEEKLIQMFSDNPVIELLDGLATEVLEVDSTESDGDLLFNFDLYVFEEYPEKASEMIENLYIGGIEEYVNN